MISKKAQDTINSAIEHGPHHVKVTQEDLGNFENVTIKELRQIASNPATQFKPNQNAASIVSIVVAVIFIPEK
jgi:hypothetical protein